MSEGQVARNTDKLKQRAGKRWHHNVANKTYVVVYRHQKFPIETDEIQDSTVHFFPMDAGEFLYTSNKQKKRKGTMQAEQTHP